MKFFIDTANVEEIKEAVSIGVIDGVTTNPSLVAKTGRKFGEVLKEITGLVPGPVSAEVTAVDFDGMMSEARKYAKVADNVVVKVPLIVEGLRAVAIDAHLHHAAAGQAGSREGGPLDELAS